MNNDFHTRMSAIQDDDTDWKTHNFNVPDSDIFSKSALREPKINDNLTQI